MLPQVLFSLAVPYSHRPKSSIASFISKELVVFSISKEHSLPGKFRNSLAIGNSVDILSFGDKIFNSRIVTILPRITLSTIYQLVPGQTTSYHGSV
jgi:hypothetical protein